MRRIASFVYHRIDDNVFETCIKSLRSVSGCDVIVYTDNTPKDLRRQFNKQYKIEWRNVNPILMRGQRAVFKVLATNELAEVQPEGTQIIISDVDVYFLKDPFEAFDKTFDLGITGRSYDYWIPINGGLYFYRMSERLVRFLDYMSKEVDEPTWGAYVKFQREHNHFRFGKDWSRGQDFLNVCWRYRDEVKDVFHVKVRDLGPSYNYCPGVDVVGLDEAKRQVVNAYKQKSAHVLHLKSMLKELVYENVFELAVTKHPKGHCNWEAVGK